jgi:hypothetical protein
VVDPVRPGLGLGQIRSVVVNVVPVASVSTFSAQVSRSTGTRSGPVSRAHILSAEALNRIASSTYAIFLFLGQKTEQMSSNG